MAAYSALEVKILANTTGYIKVHSRLIDSREFFMLSEKIFNPFACCDFLIVVGAKEETITRLLRKRKEV